MLMCFLCVPVYVKAGWGNALLVLGKLIFFNKYMTRTSGEYRSVKQFALTCALQRQSPFDLTPLFLLDIMRIHGQHLLTRPEQKKHQKHGGHIFRHTI